MAVKERAVKDLKERFWRKWLRGLWRVYLKCMGAEY